MLRYLLLLILSFSPMFAETQSIVGVWDYSGFKDRTTFRLHIREDHTVTLERLQVRELAGEHQLYVELYEGVWYFKQPQNQWQTRMIEIEGMKPAGASFSSGAYPKDLVVSGWEFGHRYRRVSAKHSVQDLVTEWKLKQLKRGERLRDR